jgi:hypothetical protein
LRYPGEFPLELLSGEMTSEQVLSDYPDLELDDLRAAFAYAAHLIRVKSIEPLTAWRHAWRPTLNDWKLNLAATILFRSAVPA